MSWQIIAVPVMSQAFKHSGAAGGRSWSCTAHSGPQGHEGHVPQLQAAPGGTGPVQSHSSQEPHALQVETLTSLKALGRFVDSSQVTAELEGTFPYCHGEWVQFFQVSRTAPSATSSLPTVSLCPQSAEHRAAFLSHPYPQPRTACCWPGSCCRFPIPSSLAFT